jgi:hypothetical protein
MTASWASPVAGVTDCVYVSSVSRADEMPEQILLNFYGCPQGTKES